MDKVALICIINLSVGLLCDLSLASIYDDRMLYEGSKCNLPESEGGGEGKCVKTFDCPKKVEDIRQGIWSSEGRCGFVDDVEIVCCSTAVVTKGASIEQRVSGTACNRFRKAAAEVNEERFAPLVYNGVEAQTGEFPFVVALGYNDTEDEESINGIKYDCGGTLISERHVLTAGHCVSTLGERVPVEVRLGAIKLTEGLSVPISRIIPHPDYRRSVNYNDIAILELQRSVNFSYLIQPICLLTDLSLLSTRAEKPSMLSVLGWGEIDISGARSKTLVKAERLAVVEVSDCDKLYTNIRTRIPNGLDDGMICVTDPDRSRSADTCSGDSGGPLVTGNANAYTLVGVTSFGQACGTRIPGVYTSVNKYLPWIEDVVWPNSN